jgi:predicted PolB exonuclease-like 3'-5' exonuclease
VTSFPSTSTTRSSASERSSRTGSPITGLWTLWAPPTWAAFCDKIAELSPQLVTFNGNSFDLPVLRYRAMVHGVSAPGLSTRPYFHRYTDDAIDLCDALSSFSPQGKATLHEISRAMGLPGKPKGIDGAEVERYFHEGKVKEIADYCEGDVVNTYQVWLRYELFRGTLSQDAFEKSQWNLEDFMNVRGNTKKLPGIM